jgi:uncharacterized protein YhaN
LVFQRFRATGRRVNAKLRTDTMAELAELRKQEEELKTELEALAEHRADFQAKVKGVRERVKFAVQNRF